MYQILLNYLLNYGPIFYKQGVIKSPTEVEINHQALLMAKCRLFDAYSEMYK